MILASGHDTAFTYTSQELHGKAARKWGEPLFHPSPDVANVKGRNFDYTVVLDSDTGLAPGMLEDILKVGEAYPYTDIIQPAIQFNVDADDSVFAQLEMIRQTLFSPMTQVQTSFFSKSPFFGKGVIRTRNYMANVIGTPEAPLDVVPVDVLSHDTFEAAVTTTLFVPDAFMLEKPCTNYASWSEREMRWNRGELILACYFWPHTFGAFVRWLQGKAQPGKEVVCTKASHVEATVRKLDAVSLYFGHGALRTMSMKLVLLVYLFLAALVDEWCRFRRLPLVLVLCAIIVIPKMAIFKSGTLHITTFESVSSLLLYTTEAFIGSARVIRAFVGLALGRTTWTPQAAIEAEFEGSNPWVHALRYLWPFSLSAAIILAAFRFLSPETMGVELSLNLVTVLILPLYVGFTSARAGVWRGATDSLLGIGTPTPPGHSSK